MRPNLEGIKLLHRLLFCMQLDSPRHSIQRPQKIRQTSIIKCKKSDQAKHWKSGLHVSSENTSWIELEKFLEISLFNTEIQPVWEQERWSWCSFLEIFIALVRARLYFMVPNKQAVHSRQAQSYMLKEELGILGKLPSCSKRSSTLSVQMLGVLKLRDHTDAQGFPLRCPGFWVFLAKWLVRTWCCRWGPKLLPASGSWGRQWLHKGGRDWHLKVKNQQHWPPLETH